MRLIALALLLFLSLSSFKCEPMAIAQAMIQERDGITGVSVWQLPVAQQNATSPVGTTLILNASRSDVFIGEDLLVYGSLNIGNGSVLVGRRVTITFGDNLTVTSTGYYGEFKATISFPVGFPAGPTAIEAAFDPEAADSELYLSSRSSVLIQVSYHPSSLEAEIYPKDARPLDTVQVTGRLSSVPENESLESRMIVIHFDSAFVGNTTTNSTGQFRFGFSIPLSVGRGGHNVTAAFPAIGDGYAPSNATLPLNIEALEARVNFSADRTSLFSGMSVTIQGTVTLTNGTVWKYGQAKVYLDDSFSAIEMPNAEGVFSSTIQLPIGTNFGWHLLKVRYTPDESSINGSEATVPVFVLNTPLITIASGVVIGLLSLSVYRTIKKRRPPVLAAPTLPQLPVMEKPSPEAYPPEMGEYSADGLTSMIEAEHDHAAKVRRSYRLAQAMLGQKLHEEPHESETHWEYFHRVTKKAPNVEDSFKRLSELFELAEYSQTPMGRAQSEEATKLLLRVREEIGGENKQEYGNEYQV
jgi:hypothetical protein